MFLPPTFSRMSCDSLIAIPLNRAVEKHMQTFLHREKKKVRTTLFLCIESIGNMQNFRNAEI